MYLTINFYRNILLILFLSFSIGSTTCAASSQTGTLMLFGGVLRYNQHSVWKHIVELAGGDLAEIVVISAAHERAKVYGEFAVRALMRYGPQVELLPLAVSSDEFDTDYHRIVHEPKFINQVLEANAIFFVAGSPQRLSKVLLENNHSLTPLAIAIREVYLSGGVIIGGIPEKFGVSTGNDAMDTLKHGKVVPENLYQGLNLINNGWFINQHLLSLGRFTETLVAMNQTENKHGIGIYADTTVIFKNNNFEVFGKGVILIDFSDAKKAANIHGFDLKGVRLSHLTDGDQFNTSTLKITIHPKNMTGFKIDPNAVDRQPILPNQRVSDSMLTQRHLRRFMATALDSDDRRTIGLVFNNNTNSNDTGFKFRFFTGKDTWGWLTNRFESDRYISHNIYMDVSPITRKEAEILKQ